LLLGIVSSFLRLLPPVSGSPRNRGKSKSRYVCVATVHSVMEVGERRIEGLPDTMHK